MGLRAVSTASAVTPDPGDVVAVTVERDDSPTSLTRSTRAELC
jgi:hypothetical protein